MTRTLGFACLATSVGLSLACNKGSDIERQTRELTEAQSNTGAVVKDLEGRLEKAKAEVIALEKKLALAREGVTDEVVKERAELQGALDEQRGEVQKELNEARREAQALNKDTDRAIEQLERTQPPAQVDARLKTETDVVRGAQQPVEAPPREEIVKVRGGPEPLETPDAGADERPDPGKVESTTSVTRSAPAPAAPEAPPRDDAPAP